MNINREVGARLIRSGGYIINLQAKALLLPWNLCRVWLSGSLNILLALFHLMGIMPNEFSNRVKIAELNRHIDNMHQREDEYRRRLQLLSDQLETQSRQKSKAIKKLQRARAETEELSQSLDGLQMQGVQEGSDGGGQDGSTLTHVLLWSAVLAVYFNSRTMASLQLKLLFTVFIPVVLMYFMMQTSGGRNWKTIVVQCVSAGVLGFTLHHMVC